MAATSAHSEVLSTSKMAKLATSTNLSAVHSVAQFYHIPSTPQMVSPLNQVEESWPKSGCENL
jgi:hypothetical protein